MALKPRITPTLAKRFLLSKSSGGFLSFVAWVTVLGVLLGVLALVSVTSVINGFEGELTRVITGMNGDVVLYTYGNPVPDPENLERKIRTIPETRSITRSFVTEIMVAGPEGVAGAVLDGFDSETLGQVTHVPDRVIEGRLPARSGEIALGAALAERIGARVGESVRLIAPFAGERDEAEDGLGQPRVTQANVSGIVRMGMYTYDSKFVFAPLESVQEFLTQPGRVTNFKITLKDRARSEDAAERLAENFGYPFKAKDWARMNRNLFIAIELEKAVIAIILTAIIIVAAFNVVSSLMIMIHDKSKEISILKAMGFTPARSFRLFALIGGAIGVTGTVLGVLAGLGVNELIERLKLIDLPADVYYISFLPVVARWDEIGLIAVLAFCITFAAAIYPAWRVSRRPPLEGLRYE